jgi:hypothetical protein
MAAARRLRDMDHTSFYEWKRRFQTRVSEGLKDLPPIHKSHRLATPPEVMERIIRPCQGCSRGGS